MSFLNTVASLEDLHSTPSGKDGMSRELEWNCRRTGANYIQCAGRLLKLPQAAMATGQTLFQRYFYVESFVYKPWMRIAMAALFVACKVEESPRRRRDIVSVFDYLIKREIAPDGVKILDGHGSEVSQYQEELLSLEVQVLSTLGFDVHVTHPHGFLLNILNALNLTSNQKLVQLAWNYLNDALQTNIYVCYQPSTIACASIFLASLKLNVSLEQSPPWFIIFDTCEEDLKNIAGAILKLYSKSMVSYHDLQAEIKKLKE